MTAAAESPAQAAKYLSEAETSAILQGLEAKHDLLRHTIDGWAAWPLLRFAVSRSLQNLPLDKGGVSGLTRGQLLGEALRDLAAAAWPRRTRFLAKTFSSLHAERRGGSKQDIFFDDLQSIAGYYKLEQLNSPRIYADPAPYVQRRDSSGTLLAVLTGRMMRLRPPAEAAPVAAELSRCLRQELALEGYMPEAIAATLAGFVWAKRLNRALLARVRPKCLLLADTADYPITAAARELGIKVVEFQHGLTHRHFPGNSWTRDALRYKRALPLPHRIFTFGGHWQRELAALGFWSDELRVVGSVRVDSYRGLPPPRTDASCAIVVTTQGTDTERLIAFLADFVRQAKPRLQFQLFIKLHPSYATSAQRFHEAFAGESSVVIVLGSEQPSTFELLQRAHLHVSIYSTCHYEALALGVPTVIVPLTGHENVVHLHEAGHAALAATPAEMVAVAAGCRERRVRPEVGAEYFAPGAQENIRRELEALLGASAA